jgi:hypothetical protein
MEEVMSTYFTDEASVEAVNARVGPDIDPRLATVMAALVKHLHAFAKEVQLTQKEWEIGIDFLTKTGQICSEERQEFILLSDTLGFSMLVDAINNRRPQRPPSPRFNELNAVVAARRAASMAATFAANCRQVTDTIRQLERELTAPSSTHLGKRFHVSRGVVASYTKPIIFVPSGGP